MRTSPTGPARVSLAWAQDRWTGDPGERARSAALAGDVGYRLLPHPHLSACRSALRGLSTPLVASLRAATRVRIGLPGPAGPDLSRAAGIGWNTSAALLDARLVLAGTLALDDLDALAPQRRRRCRRAASGLILVTLAEADLRRRGIPMARPGGPVTHVRPEITAHLAAELPEHIRGWPDA